MALKSIRSFPFIFVPVGYKIIAVHKAGGNWQHGYFDNAKNENITEWLMLKLGNSMIAFYADGWSVFCCSYRILFYFSDVL